jgi:hypothetical protein
MLAVDTDHLAHPTVAKERDAALHRLQARSDPVQLIAKNRAGSRLTLTALIASAIAVPKMWDSLIFAALTCNAWAKMLRSLIFSATSAAP